MDRPANPKRTRIVCAGISLLIFAAYWPVLRNGFVSYDDYLYITSNPHVLGGLSWEDIAWAFRTTEGGNWHPLTWISHMVDIQLFGLRPGWHHLINLLLHTANSLLLFGFLRKSTGAFWRAALVAALFAAHPAHVESVAWASERKDLLSTLFFLLALSAYTNYVTVKQRQPGLPPALSSDFSPGFFYGLSLLLFALGLMSKSMLVTTPLVLLLLDCWPLERIQPGPGVAKTFLVLLKEKVPFFLMALCASIITVHTQKGAVTIGMPFSVHVSNAIASYFKYLGKLLWPAHLSVFYPHPYLNVLSPPTSPAYLQASLWPLWLTLGAAALLILVSAGAWLAWRREPWFATGWFWYLGTLVPVIGLVQAGVQAMADRYTYIPSIGVFVCLAWGIVIAAERMSWNPKVLLAPAMVVMVVLAALTMRQASCWRNDLTLFGQALKENPNNALAHCKVGAQLGAEGKIDLAMAHFEAALASEPKSAEALYWTGLTYEHQGDTNSALAYYEKALKENPRHEAAHVHLGLLLEQRGKTEEAIKHYGQAIGLEPNEPEARYFMALILEKAGDLEEAEQQLNYLLRLKPYDPEAHDRLAKLLLKERKLPLAQRQFEILLRLNPNDVEARINLGGILWGMGRADEALDQYNAALRINPDVPLAHYDIGVILFAQGRPMDAWMQFKEALRLKPDYVDALTDLGRTEEALGKPEEAIKQFREAARLSPTNANFQLNYANALHLAGNTNEAVDVFATALRLDSSLPEKLVLAGRKLAADGQPNAAIARFRTALCVKPDWPIALNNLAWMLATHPDAKTRNGAEAVRLAERACQLSGGKEGRYYSTLAAAYAECGRFPEAVATGEKARELAAAAGDKDALQSAETRLALYRQQQPYHQPATAQ